MSCRTRPGAALVALVALVGALGAVAAHEASALPLAAANGEPVVDTGHREQGGSAHFDSLLPRPGHECLVCWLGHLGFALAPTPAAGPALADLGAPLAGPPARVAVVARSTGARGPPLA